MAKTLRVGLAAVALGTLSFSLSAAPVDGVLSLARKEKPALIETLRQLVSIESGSRDRQGLDSMTEALNERLLALGGRVETVEPGSDTVRLFDTPSQLGKVVVAHFDGTGTKSIMLLAHMDTVYPRGALAEHPFRIDGNRAYGPGVADDRGGIAVILHTLAILKNLGFRDYRALTVVISADEELSSPGARNAITRIASQHDFVFSFEPTPAPNDELAIATSGIAAATLVVHGKAAHAGVNPQDGRNALIELAHQMLQTRDLSDPSRGIKFNWTVATAGTTRNVIPDTATASADVRVQHNADYEIIEAAFLAGVKKSQLVPGTRVEPRFERRRPPLEATPAARALVNRAEAIYAELGRRLGLDETGKGIGTDAAFAALSGKAVVVEGFGLMGYGYHSSDAEYVDLDSIEPRLYLLARLIMDAGR